MFKEDIHSNKIENIVFWVVLTIINNNTLKNYKILLSLKIKSNNLYIF